MEDLKVIFEDESILVLDKPAGMVVNRAETVRRITVQDWVEKLPSYQVPTKSRILDQEIGTIKLSSNKDSDFFRRSGIVHRLDKETSGLLLVAKTPSVFAYLQSQFKTRQVKKKYLALVHGRVKPSRGEILAPIARSPFDRKKFGVFLGGREAETRYRVIAVWDKGGESVLSLLEITPLTGRTHQIRVHLKHLGHPVVGDQKYAGRKTARLDHQWCPRQFLHANFLAFDHPVTRRRIELESPLPSDLKKALKKLKSEL